MMKKAEMQEQEFLEICSSYDYDLLTIYIMNGSDNRE